MFVSRVGFGEGFQNYFYIFLRIVRLFQGSLVLSQDEQSLGGPVIFNVKLIDTLDEFIVAGIMLKGRNEYLERILGSAGVRKKLCPLARRLEKEPLQFVAVVLNRIGNGAVGKKRPFPEIVRRIEGLSRLPKRLAPDMLQPLARIDKELGCIDLTVAQRKNPFLQR